MGENEYLGGRSPEQERAADDVEPNPDAGTPRDEELLEPGEPESPPDPTAERGRTPQAGL